MTDENEKMTYSGIIAVVAVKIVTTAYAFNAWSEKDEDDIPPNETKINQHKKLE